MLEPRRVRTWHAELMAGHLGEVSVAKCYRLLRSILNTAVEDGLLQRNPCQIKGAGSERSPERSIPTIAQVAAVSEALPPRFAAVPWVAALRALRKGELFGLARRHVDLDRATLRVERALQEQTGRGAVLKAPKTRSSGRTVGMPGLRQLRLHDLRSADGYGAATISIAPRQQSAVEQQRAHDRQPRPGGRRGAS